MAQGKETEPIIGHSVLIDVEKYKHFLSHNCSLDLTKLENDIGGKYTFLYTPTTLGIAVTVRCGCGEELNITDYGSW